MFTLLHKYIPYLHRAAFGGWGEGVFLPLLPPDFWKITTYYIVKPQSEKKQLENILDLKYLLQSKPLHPLACSFTFFFFTCTALIYALLSASSGIKNAPDDVLWAHVALLVVHQEAHRSYLLVGHQEANRSLLCQVDADP